jgi:hypothetical protein
VPMLKVPCQPRNASASGRMPGTSLMIHSVVAVSSVRYGRAASSSPVPASMRLSAGGPKAAR